MSEQKTLSGFYEQNHNRLNGLFRIFQKLKRADFAKAKESVKEIKFGLRRHIVREEDVLFHLWEEKTGKSEGGPTSVIRAEHRQIGRQLEAIHGKVADQNSDSDQEERVLYHAIDQRRGLAGESLRTVDSKSVGRSAHHEHGAAGLMHDRL